MEMNCKKQQSSLSRQSTLDERAADLQRHEPSPQRCTDVDTASLENNSKRVTQTYMLSVNTAEVEVHVQGVSLLWNESQA